MTKHTSQEFYENYFSNENYETYKYDVGAFCTRKIILSSILHKTGTVLEIGTGISSLLLGLQQFECYGIDISRKTIEKTTNLFKNLNKKATLIQADAEGLPFEENFFDVIVSSHTLEHIKNDDKVIKECLRVLKPGGEAIFFVPGNMTGIATKEEWEKLGHYRNYNSKKFKELEKLVYPNLKLQSLLFPHKTHNIIWNRLKNVIRWANYPIKKCILRDNKTYELRPTYQKFVLPILSRSLDCLDKLTIKKESTLLGANFNVLAKFTKTTSPAQKS